MKEGLDRHDAIHAVGSILAKFIWKIGRKEKNSGNVNDAYFEELKNHTVQGWYDEFSDFHDD